jgi:hypothetical protein
MYLLRERLLLLAGDDGSPGAQLIQGGRNAPHYEDLSNFIQIYGLLGAMKALAVGKKNRYAKLI